MKKAATLLLGCCLTFSGFSAVYAQTETPSVPAADAKVYGEYPIAFKEIITGWLKTKLADPTSAVVDWTDTPKPGEYKTQKGETFVGYVVDFKVNARNQFGGATGKQKYRVVIRNGEVAWGGRPHY